MLPKIPPRREREVTTRWNENGRVFVIDARGWGASRCGRRGRWSGCTYPPTHPNASSSLLPPSLLSDPSVHSREIAAGSASEGGWNENSEPLLILDPFGDDGRYSWSGLPPQGASYVAYAPPPSCSGWWAKSPRPEWGTENSMIGASPGPRRDCQ